MADTDSLLLTLPEAVAAVCFDFRHYDPQILLFSELIRLLSNGRTLSRREAGKSGLWLEVPGRSAMRWIDGPDLVEHMCRMMKTVDPDPDRIAAICARVFRTRARPERDVSTGRPVIRIETGMDAFRCRQCGQCCRNLDYRDAVTEDDAARWKNVNRQDILRRVARFPSPDGGTVYRIWMVPGTLTREDTCPFLYKIPSENRTICRIHDVKPTICREYPVSRKHGLMTGCPGFGR